MANSRAIAIKYSATSGRLLMSFHLRPIANQHARTISGRNKKRMDDENFPKNNVITIQSVIGQKRADGCAQLDPRDGLELMTAFAALQSPQDRRAVIRLAKQLASK